MAEVRTLTVGAAEEGVRLDRWFRRRWPHLTNIQIQKLARSGQIRVDGGRVKAETRLAAGAQVRVPPLPGARKASVIVLLVAAAVIVGALAAGAWLFWSRTHQAWKTPVTGQSQ